MHSRRTPNALHVSVRRKQKRFQRASEAITANSRISQIVRQRVPHRRTGHGKCPSAVGAEPVARHDQLSAAKAKPTQPTRYGTQPIVMLRFYFTF